MPRPATGSVGVLKLDKSKSGTYTGGTRRVRFLAGTVDRGKQRKPCC